MAEQREQWASGTGFILATIGSAVGIGNIWRFSYVAGENGGGAFLLIYLVCAILVGAPIVIAEMTMGRRAAGDAIAAFGSAAPGSRWAYAGWIGILGCFLILSFYSVIAGWALKYFVVSIVGTLWQAESHEFASYFRQFIANGIEPALWQLTVLAATTLVVMGGIRRGIEAANRVLMPVLALLVVAMAIYTATLPGAGGGWRFLFVPDWSAFGRSEVYIAALGQAFFSLGIGMAVFITYSSYMTKDMKTPRAAAAIVAGDTLFAIVAGLAIFPAVFAFGVSPNAGPELAFITLPQIFMKMPGGLVIGILFFGLLAAAAVTSMVSLLEVPVAAVIQRSRLGRRSAVLIIGSGVFICGIPSALSFGLLADIRIGDGGILDFVDGLISNYMLPLGGVMVCLFVGWRLESTDAIAGAGLAGRTLGPIWLWLTRLVAPAMIALIALDSAGAL